ncbi:MULTISPECIES: LuxR C-terminal-related transcriptional regulator [Vibrio]|mgnify:FL=1|jgi:LuxR family transcriptional regulator, csgAB operon transcriptional regulatory protein|uniref:Helix-turn-helix transcriptional regulator n=1 Tax=Vibrio splendidus TaxID=29497 RepID=A0A0P6ZA05_VIBSP|nr:MULTISPECIES: LuxR C-terminal-related transcriptional regulator [Vibrio]HAH02310.1 helix-turn-helix transcriptional regulator [Vibrio sp.]KPM01346.1 LuxR family transcriptional regulator [Vibrio splendidus]MBO7911432.1 helix-turn-helix transcriptional regulator [Vibrio sp. G41H]MBT9241737.1 helix-turn-helix transcriptional regulator [Vibrio splendidus]MBU2912351.1 helix-turn-helix transcriptional regulator [Vibrio splendidus]
MRKSRYARTLHFLCIDPNDTYLHVKEIEKHLSIILYKMTPDDLMLFDRKQSNRILLVDYKEVPRLINLHPNLPVMWKNHEIILFNVPKALPTSELITFGVLKGLFYNSEEKAKIAKGLEEVINGDNWLPRKVASQLLFYYRNIVSTNTTPTNVDLTIRELQVIRCLQSGSSNTQIADDLFISEFTVKSHLYQIFRKLAVKNRVQAIAWANQNLLA